MNTSFIPHSPADQLIGGRVAARWRFSFRGRKIVAVNDRRRAWWAVLGLGVLSVGAIVMSVAQPHHVGWDLAMVLGSLTLPTLFVVSIMYLLPGLRVEIDPEESVTISKRFGALAYARRHLSLTEGYLDHDVVLVPKLKKQTNWAKVVPLLFGPLGLLVSLLIPKRERHLLVGAEEHHAVVWIDFETQERQLILASRRQSDSVELVTQVDRAIGVSPMSNEHRADDAAMNELSRLTR